MLKKEKPKPKSKDIDVLELLDLVPFTAETVMDAVVGNTALYVAAIRFRLQCLEKASDAKRAWEQARAEADLEIRQDARDTGEKITEGLIAAKLLVDDDVSKLAKEHQRAEVYDEYSKLIVRVFEMRRDMLQTTASLANREYPISKMAEQAAGAMSEERRKLHKRFPGG